MKAWRYSVIAALSAAVGMAQLNPALTPQKAPKPALPKIDRHACPFEGCQFGRWTARGTIKLFSTWKTPRKLIGTLRDRESVVALTGLYVTFEPSTYVVTAPMQQYGLKPGDIVLGYMPLGEGFFNAWFNGYWVEDFDGSGIVETDGSGCSRNCNMKPLKPGRDEWWVRVRTNDGVTGWTRYEGKFDGTDALAQQ